MSKDQGNKSSESLGDCISSLEHRVHEVFAASRISGEDFVYCPNNDLFAKLDEYCEDDTNFQEERSPIVVIGPSGVGKSALLSNWLHRKKHLNASRLRGGSSKATDEFLFFHSVGCSRQSLIVTNLLYRLISNLKEKFELVRQVPKSKERLSWDLPRFLELASKKGKVIIIIDGIHRLKNQEGGEDSLSWLPLYLPPNVRIILSATGSPSDFSEIEQKIPTAPPSPMSEIRKKLNPKLQEEETQRINNTAEVSLPTSSSHILEELKRRNLQTLFVSPLDSTKCNSLINAYVQNSSSSAAASSAIGPYLAIPGQNINSSSLINGFLLFKVHIDSLLSHPLCGNPLFLRLFLKNLHFVCIHGCNLWTVFEDWIKSKTINELLDKILYTCENKFSKTRDLTQKSIDYIGSCGGLEALKELYPWHPSLKDTNTIINTNYNSSSFQDIFSNNPNNLPKNGVSANNNTSANASDDLELHTNNSPAAASSLPLTNTVLRNLENQSIRAVEHQARKFLQIAVISAKKKLTENFQSIIMVNKDEFIKEISSQISSSYFQSNLNEEESTEEKLPVLLRTRTNSFDTHSSYTSNNNLNTTSIGNLHQDSEDDQDDTYSKSSVHSDDEQSTFNNSFTNNSVGEKSCYSGLETNQNNPSNSDLLRQSYANNMSNLNLNDNIMNLPLYLRGGSVYPGFGDLLGNSLSLLYIARQGLREQELWKILSFLESKNKLKKNFSSEKKNELNEKKSIIKNTLLKILELQRGIESRLKSEDISKCGYISQEQLFNSIKKEFNSFSKNNFAVLFEFIETKFNEDPALYYEPFYDVFLEDSVNYTSFFKLLTRIKKKSPLFVGKSGSESFSTEDPLNTNQIDDNFDDFRLDDIIKDNTSNTDGQTTDIGFGTLGPVVEELLLGVLCALGVLYSPENKVLILPTESDILRETVYKRYILPRGGGSVQFWHNLIIQYFRTQPNSLRKCEELPWHLKICRKWTSLKDSLVDLKTFDLMFNNNLKDELMEYWLLLTEGPLYTTDENNDPELLNTKLIRNNDTDSTSSLILKELDESFRNKISLKEVRRRAMKNQIQTFDVVDELNRSLENWVNSEHPSPYQIYRTIEQISSFLLEFAKSSSSCPQFRRVGIDMSLFEILGIQTTDLDAAMNNKNTKKITSEENDDLNEDLKPQLQESPNTPKTNNREIKRFDSVQKKEPEKFPPHHIAVSKFYLYLRWIWIQFPWMSLHLAAQLDLSGNDKNKSDLSSTDLIEFDKEKDGESGNSKDHGKILKLRQSQSDTFLHVWNLKKSDPTVQVYSSSLNRKLAAIKPTSSVSSSLERNVSASCNKLFKELEQPSHIAQVRLGLGEAQRYGKFRRTFEEEMENTKKIPFSYHGIKVQKSGSLFPSLNNDIKETKHKKIENDVLETSNSSSSNNNSITSGGNKNYTSSRSKPRNNDKFDLDAALKNEVPNSTFMLTELDDEIRRITGEEYLQNHRIDNAHTGLIKDEVDLELDTLYERMTRMKSIWNKLLIIQKEKEKTLTELENEIILREESDRILLEEVQKGESLISALKERNKNMEVNLKEAKKLQENYQFLVRMLKKNPPYVENHVKSLEMEVELAENQFNELVQHREKLYLEAERKNGVVKKQIIEKVEYFKNARQEIAIKKKQLLRSIRKLREKVNNGSNNSPIQNSNTMTQNKNQNSPNPKQNRKSQDISDLPGEHNLDSDDSDSNSGDKENADDVNNIQLTQPVIHFLNAIVRKITYNEPIVKPTDKSLEDVKNRALNSTQESDTPKSKSESKQKKTNASAPINNNTLVNIINNNNTKNLILNSPNTTNKLVKTVKNPVQFSTNPTTTNNNRTRLTAEQVVQLKAAVHSLKEVNEISVGAINNLDPQASKELFRTQMQKAVQIIFEKTESNNVDELIERYMNAQKLHENLKSQQILADSRLEQLRTEHAELYTQWCDSSFINNQGEQKNQFPLNLDVNGLPSEDNLDENSDRYLDNKLFLKEVTLHHYQRLYDKSVHSISEIRTAIQHLMQLIIINGKLLANLPHFDPPSLKSDKDISTCLSWCEDRLIALNEALNMDTNNRTNSHGTEEMKSMAIRQQELAAVMSEMIGENNKRNNLSTPSQNRKQKGNLSKSLITNSRTTAPVTSPRSILVVPSYKIDKLYETKMSKIINERDKRETLLKDQDLYLKNSIENDEVQRFIAEGIDEKMTKNMSRKARLLLNKGTGKNGNFGLVLEELMASRGQSLANLNEKIRSNSSDNASQTINKVEHFPIEKNSSKIHPNRGETYESYLEFNKKIKK